MLRCEIEAALIDGSLDVADLPAVWKEKMRDHLGVTVPTDTLGVLQDVHWSSGMVGSFPTYTLGNVMASQFFRAATAVSGVEAGLDAGDYGPLRAWLEANVLSHGRSRPVAQGGRTGKLSAPISHRLSPTRAQSQFVLDAAAISV